MIDLPKGQEATHVLTVHITLTKAGAWRRQLQIHTDQEKESAKLTLEGMIEP
jgi:DNA-binding CsgD family transcriptional regulator